MTKVGEHITLDIIGTTHEYDPSKFEKIIDKNTIEAELVWEKNSYSWQL